MSDRIIQIDLDNVQDVAIKSVTLTEVRRAHRKNVVGEIAKVHNSFKELLMHALSSDALLDKLVESAELDRTGFDIDATFVANCQTFVEMFTPDGETFKGTKKERDAIFQTVTKRLNEVKTVTMVKNGVNTIAGIRSLLIRGIRPTPVKD